MDSLNPIITQMAAVKLKGSQNQTKKSHESGNVNRTRVNGKEKEGNEKRISIVKE